MGGGGAVALEEVGKFTETGSDPAKCDDGNAVHTSPCQLLNKAEMNEDRHP
jgi:hypothetical protein